MNSTDSRQYYLDQFAAINKVLPGQHLSWLHAKRQAAMRYFSEQGFPTRKDEDWKYTPVTAIEQQAFQVTVAQDPKSDFQVEKYLLADVEQSCHNLVFIDGVFQAQSSTIGQLPEGAVLTNLATAFEQHEKQITPYLTAYADDKAHAFSALNTAFMRDGLFLYLPEHCVIEPIIHVLFFSSQANQLNTVRNLIVLEKNSQAKVVEHFIGLHDQCYLTNSLTEVIAKQDALFEHIKLQQESKRSYHIGTLQVQQEKSSQVTTHSFSLGGGLVRSDINVNLAEKFAECHLNGLYVGEDKQHIDHHTQINHEKPQCISREYYKGILAEKAHAVFNGKVFVAQDAQKTDSEQYNKNLLLSEQAEVDTKPQLEIYADDVKCAHGATVGQLDEDALFYLRSRGISEQTARDVLIRAFAVDVIDTIQISAIKDKLAALLSTYLAN